MGALLYRKYSGFACAFIPEVLKFFPSFLDVVRIFTGRQEKFFRKDCNSFFGLSICLADGN